MKTRSEEIISYYQNRDYPNQAHRAYDMLLEMIALETLPGKKIFTESELGQLLQIGRSPLRDALKVLEANGVTQAIPRLGIQVQEVRVEDYPLQAEVRTTLEEVIIRRTCRLATVATREKLEQLNRTFAEAVEHDDMLAVYRIDRDIHKLIDECSKNPYAVRAAEPLRFFEQRVHFFLSQVYVEIGAALNREHIAFVDAIVSGQEEAACKHFRSMVEQTLKLTRQQMQPI